MGTPGQGHPAQNHVLQRRHGGWGKCGEARAVSPVMWGGGVRLGAQDTRCLLLGDNLTKRRDQLLLHCAVTSGRPLPSLAYRFLLWMAGKGTPGHPLSPTFPQSVSWAHLPPKPKGLKPDQ
jgi:hypothetical protein